jgi:hypothetical protein
VLHAGVSLLEDKSASIITRGRVFFLRRPLLLTTSSSRRAGTMSSIVGIGRMSTLLPLKYSLTCVHWNLTRLFPRLSTMS